MMPQADPMLYPGKPVLVIDDESESLDGCQFILNSAGITHVKPLSDARRVFGEIEKTPPEVVILDLSMPHVSGREILAHLTRTLPHIPVIILTGMNQVDTAVDCMKAGAFDYLVKPVEENRMISSVKKAIEITQERREYREFREKILGDRLSDPRAFSGYITASKKLRTLFQYAETIAPTRKPVLITGESGVGKEIIAKAIHQLSFSPGKMVGVNVAGLDETLFSDTLFGHLQGAFTNAGDMRHGMVKKAENGTLFLDEIGDMSTACQLKLLRLIQENEYYPIGGDAPLESSARIIAATNSPVGPQTSFRQDLYYRLSCHHIHIPALRQRPEDIPVLLDYFLEKFSLEMEKKPPTPPQELYSLLSSYEFPGNIRELESMTFEAVSLHKSRMLSMDVFRRHIETLQPTGDKQPIPDSAPPFSHFTAIPKLKDCPTLLIREALNRSCGNKDTAARLLGITRSGLNKALKRKGIFPLS